MGDQDVDSTDALINSKMSKALAAARMAVYQRDLQTDIATRIYVPILNKTSPAFPGSTAGSGYICSSVPYKESSKGIHPEDFARVRKIIDRAIEDGSDFEVEYRYSFDGEDYRWRQSNGQAYRGADGSPGNIFAITQDITAKKTLESEVQKRSSDLARARDQLAFALEAADMAAFESFGTQTSLSSPALKKMLGLNHDAPDITEERFLSIVHPLDRDEIRSKIDLRDTNKFEDEFRVVHPDGSVRWLLAKGARSIGVDGRNSTYVVIQDITSRKNSEEQLHSRTAQLTEACQKLKRFSAVVAHDLKSPLTSIAMSADIIENAQTLEEAKGYASFVRSGSRRLASLVDDLLHLAKSDQDQSKPKKIVSLRSVIEVVRANLANALSKTKAELIISGGHDAEIWGLEFQMTQVLQNLISNALKFILNEKPIIQISFIDEGTSWRVAVKDNGVGIDSSVQDRLFKPFERLHAKQFEGTGLGLSIVKQIVENHGGRVWVESEVGAGSTFQFTLPKPESTMTAGDSSRAEGAPV